LCLIEHRGDSSVPQDIEAQSGYVNQEYAIALAEKAGFVLKAVNKGLSAM
jgi:predicted methyltransferase